MLHTAVFQETAAHSAPAGMSGMSSFNSDQHKKYILTHEFNRLWFTFIVLEQGSAGSRCDRSRPKWRASFGGQILTLMHIK